jgi:UPF0755 protein
VRHEVRLIEGWRFSQVRAALAADRVLVHDTEGLDDSAVMAALGEGGRSPEGLFFPDTYAFTRGEGELALLTRARVRLEAQLAAAWSERDPSVEAVLAGPYDALILASIIEKETAAPPERPLIASVFVRRLAIGMRLQTDPTVIFGLGEAFDGNLRRSHLQADGPYNTYTRTGLPPTPIALVGRAALQAAVQPSEGKALYFVSRGDGTHYFSENYQQHLKAVREFQLKPRRAEKSVKAVEAADSVQTADASATDASAADAVQTADAPAADAVQAGDTVQAADARAGDAVQAADASAADAVQTDDTPAAETVEVGQP